MIICKRPVHLDDHLQEACPSGWSFARGRRIQMIICKRPVHQDDYLQEAGQFRWSFAKGRSIRMIICKRPDNSDDHLREAGSSRWLFAKGWPLQMIIWWLWNLKLLKVLILPLFSFLYLDKKHFLATTGKSELDCHSDWIRLLSLGFSNRVESLSNRVQLGWPK